MDSLSHMNNTVYFRLMEQCRIEWFGSFGQTLRGDEAVYPVLVSANCNFIRAITYPAVVTTTMYLGSASSRSLETYHDLLVEGVVYAQGLCRLVWVASATQKAVSVPEVVIQMIQRA
jgi:acyl-CoA thioester hydrolase